MTLRDVTPPKDPVPSACCTRQMCQQVFPDAPVGALVICDQCNQHWINALLLGWVRDVAPRCTRCHKRIPPPPVVGVIDARPLCEECKKPHRPSTPMPERVAPRRRPLWRAR